MSSQTIASATNSVLYLNGSIEFIVGHLFGIWYMAVFLSLLFNVGYEFHLINTVQVIFTLFGRDK